MATGTMLRLIQNFSALNTHTTAWSICQRGISNKTLLDKLGLPEKPKKPLSAFFKFMENTRSEIRARNPNASLSEISKMMGKRWEQFDEREKQRMLEEYKKEYKKYKVELEKYNKSLTEQQKAEIREAEADIKAMKEQRLTKLIKVKRQKELQKPKRPMTPFLAYAMETFSPPVKIADHMKIMKEKWRRIPESTRQKYKQEYMNSLEKFNKDLALWEEEMIKQGNLDMVRSKTLKQKLKVYS